MKKSIQTSTLTALAAATLGLFVQSAWADFIPLPIKWSQPIGLAADGVTIFGADRLSDHTALGPNGPVVRADDFICNSPDLIVAVRWWGSYIGEGPGVPGLQPRPVTGPGAIGPFDISFHYSTANGNPAIHPLSLPVDPPLYFATVGAQEFFVGVDQAGDYVYRYDAYLPSPFQQQGTTANPIEYFIDIDKPTRENWGWHESPFGGLDFPAVAPTHGGPWANDPPHDLAFELMTVPEPSMGALLGCGMLLALIHRRKQIRQ